MTALSPPVPSSAAALDEAETAVAPRAEPLSFPAVFHECFPLVWRLLRTLGVRDPWLDDAVQEVFVIVHQKLPRFDGQARVTTWVHAIAYRVAANVRRRQVRELQQVELSESDAPSPRTPEHDALTSEAARFVQTFCDGLSDAMRDVFVLCFLEDFGQTEVAHLLGISPSTVASRVRLLRRAYRVALEQRKRQEAQL